MAMLVYQRVTSIFLLDDIASLSGHKPFYWLGCTSKCLKLAETKGLRAQGHPRTLRTPRTARPWHRHPRRTNSPTSNRDGWYESPGHAAIWMRFCSDKRWWPQGGEIQYLSHPKINPTHQSIYHNINYPRKIPIIHWPNLLSTMVVIIHPGEWHLSKWRLTTGLVDTRSMAHTPVEAAYSSRWVLHTKNLMDTEGILMGFQLRKDPLKW